MHNPPREDRPRNSTGYAAGALEQSRWRNNSGPGPDLKIHVPRCSYELKFNHQVNAIPESSTVVKPSHRVDIADTWREQLRITFTCCNQRLKSEQLQIQKEHILKDVIITINIYGCEANRNSKVTQHDIN